MLKERNSTGPGQRELMSRTSDTKNDQAEKIEFFDTWARYSRWVVLGGMALILCGLFAGQPWKGVFITTGFLLGGLGVYGVSIVVPNGRKRLGLPEQAGADRSSTTQVITAMLLIGAALAGWLIG